MDDDGRRLTALPLVKALVRVAATSALATSLVACGDDENDSAGDTQGSGDEASDEFPNATLAEASDEANDEFPNATSVDSSDDANDEFPNATSVDDTGTSSGGSETTGTGTETGTGTDTSDSGSSGSTDTSTSGGE